MSEHDDKQFEAYLAGDSPLSEQYRLADEDGPPATLDARVLEHARQAIVGDIDGVEARRLRRWIVPLSTAAVIVLAATLVMEMTLPGGPSVSRLVDESTDATETSPVATLGRAQPAAAGESTSMDSAPSTDGVEAVDVGEPASYYGANPMPPPSLADDSQRQEAIAATNGPALESGRRADVDRDGRLDSISARVQSVPSVSLADEPPAAMEAAAPKPPVPKRAGPTSDASPAMRLNVVPDRSGTAAQDADAPDADPEAEVFAKRLANELSMRAARDMAPASGVAAFAGAPGEDIDVSDDQLQALSLRVVLGLVDDGREDEAVRMLDEVLERWPDLELPVDFPLPDPREDP